MTQIAQTPNGEKSIRPRIAYFFLGQEPGGRFHGYPHVSIVVAEGLATLGWRIASDATAWRPSPDEPFLFPGRAASPAPKDCDLLVVGEDFFMLQGSPALPEAVLEDTVPSILLDRSDLGLNLRELCSPSYRIFRAIFRTHGNERFSYPANVRNMVFGISDRIAEASADAALLRDQPRAGLIWNFRHKKWPHTVRLWAEKEVRPLLKSRVPFQSDVDPDVESTRYSSLMAQQTEGRHFPAYYERMARASMAACFGGWFLLPVRQQEAGPICMLGRKLFKLTQRPTSMMAQWDSWRMWEAFAAGTTVLHVDMSENGFLFGGPKPEPMKHYIGVSLTNPAQDLASLLDDPTRVLAIGEAGRAWAMEHYTSKPIAERILLEVGL